MIKIKLKKILPYLVYCGSSIVLLSGCGIKYDSKKVSELLEDTSVKNDTLLDELAESGQLQFNEELSLIEAADRLETYMNICVMLDKKNLDSAKELEPLSEEDCKIAENYNEDDVKELIKNCNCITNDSSKSDSLRFLHYLKGYCRDWINENGKDVSVRLMINSIKAAIADDLIFDVSEYKNISIPPYNSDFKGDESFYVLVGDERITVDTNKIANAIDYIYILQRKKKDEVSDDMCREALNSAKETMLYAANVKDSFLNLNGTIVDKQNDRSYVKKMFE